MSTQLASREAPPPKGGGSPFAPKRICQALLKHKLITQEQAAEVFKQKDNVRRNLEKRRSDQPKIPGQTPHPITMIDIIAAMKFERADRVLDDGTKIELEEDTIYRVMAKDWKVPYKKIDPIKLDLNLVTTTIPRTFAMKHLVLPIELEDKQLKVATPNPFNTEVMDDIERVTQYRISPVVTSKTDLIKLINEFFGFKRSIAEAESQFSKSIIDLGNFEQYVKLKSADELIFNDQHIVNAVNHLFSYAFDQKASDIHIEPKRDSLMVRMRIDGVLHTVYKLPKKVHNAIVSRIKTLSRLDTAEKRRPQDGRIKTDKGGVEVEIRISTVPVAFGEKLVMRIMDPDILFQDLEGLGFGDADLSKYDRFITHPHGIILVTGPTGSGKSTTLYSSLRKISSPEINITTVEDPIEMIHEDFNQIAVQPAVDITFSTILRTLLRQDPDVIMIGEMRDLETAQNAIQASLTGHLVLSTLHTNDAPTTITRLLDLGVPPFLIQATLIGIMAQRLVRKICKHCKEPFTMSAEELRALGIAHNQQGEIKLHRGKGCNRCRGTGYKGRIGVFEVLPYTEAIKKMTTSRANITNIRMRAREEGMVTLRENAVLRMLEGSTTFQEVLRVTTV